MDFIDLNFVHYRVENSSVAIIKIRWITSASNGMNEQTPDTPPTLAPQTVWKHEAKNSLHEYV